jgi:hypothetical protein
MEHFLGHKEQFWGQTDQGPPKRSQAMPHDVNCFARKKNNLPHFQNQRYINS